MEQRQTGHQERSRGPKHEAWGTSVVGGEKSQESRGQGRLRSQAGIQSLVGGRTSKLMVDSCSSQQMNGTAGCLTSKTAPLGKTSSSGREEMSSDGPDPCLGGTWV